MRGTSSAFAAQLTMAYRLSGRCGCVSWATKHRSERGVTDSPALLLSWQKKS